MNTVRLIRLLPILGVLCGSVPAYADTLKVGLSSEPTALDPHFWNGIPNNQVNSQMFEALVSTAPDASFRPGLAESWRLVNDTTWEFKIRKNVKFHDGSSFDANDVIFSFCRVPTVINSPLPFTIFTKSIKEMTAPDPHTVLVKTKSPYPLLLNELSLIQIISDGLVGGEKVTFVDSGCTLKASWPVTADFNGGKNAIGTGPYKYGEYSKGDRVVLKRNESYWGKKPQAEQVQFRMLTSPAPRMAALLSGDVSFIEKPPIQDIERVTKNPDLRVASTVSTRVIYVAMDQRSDTLVPPGVSGTNGKNPFRDERVRKALSMAINREDIAQHLMKGFAKPAEQLLAKEFFGSDPTLKPLPYDPEGAKKLLAQAGYPNGFELTLAGPNDRYVNDGQIAQAIAQMWSRVGVKTSVNTMTASIFFGKRTKNEFGIWLAGWGAQTYEISSPLRALAATPDKDKGWGAGNAGLYSDKVLDDLIDQALATVDDAKRKELLHKASRRSVEKMGVIPIHYELSTWAMKKDLDYTPRMDETTIVSEIAVKQ